MAIYDYISREYALSGLKTDGENESHRFSFSIEIFRLA
jgi:hypothetical protein